MSSDVNFSLANALFDFGAARRIDPKGLETTQNTDSDEAARTPRFDHLVSDHEQASRVAAQTRVRNEAPEPQRTSRPADRRPASTHRPERPEASACADKDVETAARKEEAPVAKADETTAPAKDVSKASDEAEKPVTSDAAGVETEDAKADAATAATTALATPATTPVAEQATADTMLVADTTPPTGASAVIDPASAGVPTDAMALLAQTGAVPGATTPAATTTSEVPPTSVPTVGSATAAPTVDAGILAATAAKAGETAKTAGKPESQSATTQNASDADAADAAEASSSAVSDKQGPDAKTQLAAVLNGEKKTPAPDGTGVGKGDKASSTEGTGEKSATTKSANPNLHPTRAAHFADALEGFFGSNAIHRPTDILAGLDRSVAASAMNRTSDIARPTPLQMLPIEIGMQAVRGVTSFQIRLDPAELGRVDVKLHIQDNGEVKANLIVDRPDTLNMLRRDASTLQNAFEQAGLKQAPDGLTFSLRGEGQQGQQQEQGRQSGRNSSDISDDLALQAQIGEAAMRRVLIPNSSIDRMV